MPRGTFHFPRGFLWGTATAAYQVEGNNPNSHWWAWEQAPGHIADGGKSGLACDWWNGRWRDDFDRAAQAGQNAHRMSVEWSRVQPRPEVWDEDAIDRYREMLRGLSERNLVPLVTLHHYSDPQWFVEMGGWQSPEAAALFEKYVRKVVEALKEYCSLWVTINEPNAYAFHCYLLGDFPPGKQDTGLTLRATENLIRAHAAAYRAIHSLQPAARVGISLYYRGFQAAKSPLPFNRLAAWLQDRFNNQLFPRALTTGTMLLPTGSKRLPEAKNTLDFFGLAYYTVDDVSFDPRQAGVMFARRYFAKEADLSESGYTANRPEGLFNALHWAKSFNLPILITENGIDDSTDAIRPRFLAAHVHQVWRAVNFNWPIKGYFHWTLVDNFEWDRGWTQRFGLWELNLDSQARRKRPSADLYAEICRENGLSYEMVARYAPQAVGQIFPE